MDLKLENILMGKDYQLKLTDFETCYFKNDEDESLKGHGKGTADYRAPEVIEGCC